MPKSTFHNIPRTLKKSGVTKINIWKPTKTDQNRLKYGKNDRIPNTKFTIKIESTTIIKSAIEFKLLNQFLVWVAQKVISLSDLDLLLTKYYKKRLNFQIKNGITNTIDYTLTELTELQLPANWTSYTNLSAANFFPLTSPSLLLL